MLLDFADMTTTEASKLELVHCVISTRANFLGVYSIDGF